MRYIAPADLGWACRGATGPNRGGAERVSPALPTAVAVTTTPLSVDRDVVLPAFAFHLPTSAKLLVGKYVPVSASEQLLMGSGFKLKGKSSESGSRALKPARRTTASDSLDSLVVTIPIPVMESQLFPETPATCFFPIAYPTSREYASMFAKLGRRLETAEQLNARVHGGWPPGSSEAPSSAARVIRYHMVQSNNPDRLPRFKIGPGAVAFKVVISAFTVAGWQYCGPESDNRTKVAAMIAANGAAPSPGVSESSNASSRATTDDSDDGTGPAALGPEEQLEAHLRRRRGSDRSAPPPAPTDSSLARGAPPSARLPLKARDEGWTVLWAKRVYKELLMSMDSRYQKVNHFPGTWGVGRKDNLHANISKMREKFGGDHFDITPKTFVIPQEAVALHHDCQSAIRRRSRAVTSESELAEGLDPSPEATSGTGAPLPTYIVKPCAGSCGKGIFLCRGVPNVPAARLDASRDGALHASPRPPSDGASGPEGAEAGGDGGEDRIKRFVVQRYLDPFLVDGRKFDLRLYVVVTSFVPLRIHLFDQGLVRFAAMPYPGATALLHNTFMHLTNYAINKTAADTAAAKIAAASRSSGGRSGGGISSAAPPADEDDDDDEGEGGGGAPVEIKWLFTQLREYFITAPRVPFQPATSSPSAAEAVLGVDERLPLPSRGWLAAHAPDCRPTQASVTAGDAVVDRCWRRHLWDDVVVARIHDVIIKTLLSIESDVSAQCKGQCHDPSGYGCFELYGFDVMLASNLRPQVIEVNIMPSLSTGEMIDKAVKARLLAHLLTLIGPVPIAWSATESHRGRTARPGGGGGAPLADTAPVRAGSSSRQVNSGVAGGQRSASSSRRDAAGIMRRAAASLATPRAPGEHTTEAWVHPRGPQLSTTVPWRQFRMSDFEDGTGAPSNVAPRRPQPPSAPPDAAILTQSKRSRCGKGHDGGVWAPSVTAKRLLPISLLNHLCNEPGVPPRQPHDDGNGRDATGGGSRHLEALCASFVQQVLMDTAGAVPSPPSLARGGVGSAATDEAEGAGGSSSRGAASAVSSTAATDVPLKRRHVEEEIMMLVDAEEEQHRRGGFLRIFPTADTAARYFPLMLHGVSRANYVMAAWEAFKETLVPA